MKDSEQRADKQQKKIIHIDMDCFFAAVEMRDNPELKRRAIAVGGSERQRGVISTCNYEARKFGVRSAMATATAKKLCPNLVLVPGRMEVYKQVSQQIRAIFERYTSLIEPLSLDEAFLDVTDSPHCHGSATLIAQAIRNDIATELQLTASAGIAPIKFLAKVASDINKPDGQCVITPNQVQAFIDPLPLEKIPGVGKVALAKLHAAGLYTCLDIRRNNYRELLRQFGRLGGSLWKKSHGIDEREVIPHRERKSVGVETTLTENITTYDQCWALIEHTLYPNLIRRFAAYKDSRTIQKIGMKVKFADFKQTTIEQTHTVLELDFFRHLLVDVIERQHGREIRLLGLSIGLEPEIKNKQLRMFE
jgi:DNA polymerase-4